MSKIWPHASPQEPCPICNKTDWCTFGDRAILCQRVESTHAHPKCGWYHFYDETKYTPPTFLPKKEAPAQIDAEKLILGYRKETKEFQYNILAQELGILPQALMAIGAAWCEEKRAWAFPMYDGDGKVVGIRLRNRQGFKWAMTGSRQGIFLPAVVVPTRPIAYFPEGPTDTAAGLSIGLYTIGRPTCQSGNDQVKAILQKLGIRKGVIISDNDELKKLGPREGRPGIEGALKMKRELGIPTVIWIPPSPIKDLREFVKRGGTAALIESEINQKVWTRK